MRQKGSKIRHKRNRCTNYAIMQSIIVTKVLIEYSTMYLDNFKIPSIYLHILIESMTEYGIDEAALLKNSNLSNITSDTFISLQVISDIALRAVKLSHESTLGIALGQKFTLLSHGILGYTALNSKDLFSAAKLFEKYISIRIPIIKINTIRKSDQFILEFVDEIPPGAFKLFLYDVILSTIKSAIYQLQPKLNHKLTINFTYLKPKDFQESYFNECLVKFNQPKASIQINIEDVITPTPFSNTKAYKEAEILCKKELISLTESSSLKNMIKNILFDKLNNFPSQIEMASLFNMTSRTLQRKLSSENTSYREIIEETKKTLAVSYLNNSNLSLKEIAYFLGYDDSRNFNKAFKLWYDISPNEYRKNIKGKF